jgi:hypothetical protein
LSINPPIPRSGVSKVACPMRRASIMFPQSFLRCFGFLAHVFWPMHNTAARFFSANHARDFCVPQTGDPPSLLLAHCRVTLLNRSLPDCRRVYRWNAQGAITSIARARSSAPRAERRCPCPARHAGRAIWLPRDFAASAEAGSQDRPQRLRSPLHAGRRHRILPAEPSVVC